MNTIVTLPALCPAQPRQFHAQDELAVDEPAPVRYHALAGMLIDLIVEHANDRDLARLVPFEFARLRRLTIIACGTGFHAGEVAKYWFELLAALPVEVDIASEHRFRVRPTLPGEAALLISQSGETPDMLACLEDLKRRGIPTLALTERSDSSLARAADGDLRLRAGAVGRDGANLGLAAQLTMLLRLAIFAGSRRGTDPVESAMRMNGLARLPGLLVRTLQNSTDVLAAACHLAGARRCLFLGRGVMRPMASDAALKMRAMACLPAEAYAAGELPHAGLGLIDESVPVVALVPDDRMRESMFANIEAVAARGAKLILIGDAGPVGALAEYAVATLTLPDASPMITPILMTLPLQCLADSVTALRDAALPR